MALEIDSHIADKLPSMVKESLSKLPSEKQGQFIDEYKRKAKDRTLMLILAIIFPIQLFMLDKTGLGIAYLLTGGGCGIWYVIEIFMAYKRTDEFNESIARGICGT